jgi:hypothetical protein
VIVTTGLDPMSRVSQRRQVISWGAGKLAHSRGLCRYP